jgi:hypothetical protein
MVFPLRGGGEDKMMRGGVFTVEGRGWVYPSKPLSKPKINKKFLENFLKTH